MRGGIRLIGALGALALAAWVAAACGAGCYDFSGYTRSSPQDPTEDAQQSVEDASSDESSTAEGGSCQVSPGAACSILPPCGCLAGQACDVIFVDGRTACLSTKGLTTGQACKEPGECAPGNSCVGGACKAFCHQPQDCPVPNSLCFAVGMAETDGGSISIPGMHVCSDQCDLAIPAGRCGVGVGCVPLERPSTKSGHSACILTGTSTATCSTQEDCAPGRACLSDGKCHLWCNAAQPQSCTGQELCKPFDDPAWGVGYVYVDSGTFGVCQ